MKPVPEDGREQLTVNIIKLGRNFTFAKLISYPI